MLLAEAYEGTCLRLLRGLLKAENCASGLLLRLTEGAGSWLLLLLLLLAESERRSERLLLLRRRRSRNARGVVKCKGPPLLPNVELLLLLLKGCGVLPPRGVVLGANLFEALQSIV